MNLRLLMIGLGLVIGIPFCCAQEQTHHYYKGFLGAKEVTVMHLTREGEQLAGQCYDQQTRKVWSLEGTCRLKKNGQWKVQLAIPIQNRVFELETLSWATLEGHIISENDAIRKPVELNIIHVEQDTGSCSLEALWQFQRSLSHFGPTPKFPFVVHDGMEQPMARSAALAFPKQTLLPYSWAKRYIMDQLKLPTENGVNYYKIGSAQYRAHAYHYQALGKLVETPHYVGLLCRLYGDTGWEHCDISLLLLFDHAGQLLDAQKVAQVLELENNNKELRATWTAIFRTDGIIQIQAKEEHIYHQLQTLKRETNETAFYWFIDRTGRLRKAYTTTFLPN